MALLLLRHALTLGNGDEDGDDASTFFTVSGACMIKLVYSMHFSIHDSVFTWSDHFDHMVDAAILASGCQFSSPLLYHGVGYQYTAT